MQVSKQPAGEVGTSGSRNPIWGGGVFDSTRPYHMQNSYIGNTSGFQADEVGSIPTFCSNTNIK